MSEWITITRGKLYKEVWETPISKLCKKYGLSDVGLAKICKRNNIPKPPLGYWTKIYAGQKLKKPKLPLTHSKDKTIQIFVDLREKEHLSPEIKAAIDNLSDISIQIKGDLRRTHRLIKQSYEIFKSSPTDHKEILEPSDNSCLDIRVSKKSLRRALLIMDSIIQFFQTISCETTIESNKTLITIKGVPVRIKIHEMFNAVQISRQKYMNNRYSFAREGKWYRSIPSGKLCLTIDEPTWIWEKNHKQNWRDTDKTKIESRLKTFIKAVVTASFKKGEYCRKEEEKRRIREEKERIRAEKLERYNIELERLNELINQTQNYKKSKDIRELTIEVERRFKSGEPIEFLGGVDTIKWVAWAKIHADRLDPFCKSPESILDENIEDLKSPVRYF